MDQVDQRFSTWGMRPLGGKQADHRGYAERLYGYNSYLGVCKGGKILIWGTQRGTILILGYAEGYNSYLGVREFQKVENP